MRTQIIINGQSTAQENNFNYLENYIVCDEDYGIHITFGKFQNICGAINRIFRR